MFLSIHRHTSQSDTKVAPSCKDYLEQILFRLAVLVCKCMTRRAPEYPTSKFVRRSAVSTRITRNSQLLNIPLFRTASGQRTFENRAISLWNELQPALKLSESVTDFKRLLIDKVIYFSFLTLTLKSP